MKLYAYLGQLGSVNNNIKKVIKDKLRSITIMLRYLESILKYAQNCSIEKPTFNPKTLERKILK